MLTIIVPGGECYNPEEGFFNVPDVKLNLEHSLISISKWEAKWQKPFLKSDKTNAETLDYIRCMIINPNVDPSIVNRLSRQNVLDIKAYIDSPQTATVITERENGNNEQFLTSELIYYYMVANNIPVEFERWHINRLITLIKVCGIENNKGANKMSSSEIMRQNAQLNAARRAALHSKG